MCLPNAKNVYKVEREWNHAGLLCAVVQGREGSNRCGYVRIPSTHPYYKKEYSEVDVEVHGGLTYAAIEPCVDHEDGIGWWFGFDCAHSGDASYDPDNLPQHQRDFIQKYPQFAGRPWYEHFWTHDEVVSETEALADRLAAVAGK